MEKVTESEHIKLKYLNSSLLTRKNHAVDIHPQMKGFADMVTAEIETDWAPPNLEQLLTRARQ